jgi:hypothetical protein
MHRTLRFLLPLVVLLAGCNKPSSSPAATASYASADSYPAGLSAWIDRPLDRNEYALGDSIPIRWHAANTGGIKEVEIRINGEVWQVSKNPDPERRLVTDEVEWNPTEAGEYLIQAIPYGSAGNAGPAADKRITVLAEGGTVEGAVFADLNQDEDADDPGEGPLEGVTVVLAECTEKLSLITAADGAFRFDGLPFGTDCRMDFDKHGWLTTGTFPVAIDLPIHVSPRIEPAVFSVFMSPMATPTPTPSPTPTVTLTPTVTRTPLPTKTPIPDHDPPPKAFIISPKSELVGCLTDIVLRWSEVEDPSGIDYYEVTLRVDTGGANFVSVGTWNVSGTSLNVNAQTDCGSTYGWYVRARDKAGNWGAFDYALFGIDLP